MKKKRKRVSGKKTTGIKPRSRLIRTALASVKPKRFTRIDPGIATICAALLTVIVPLILNIPKIWAVNPPPSSIESLVSEKEKRYVEINSELANRRRESQKRREAVQASNESDVIKQTRLRKLDEYDAANEKAHAVLDTLHPNVTNDLRANDLVSADRRASAINGSLVEEGLQFGIIETYERRNKEDLIPMFYFRAAGRYSAPPVFYRPPVEHEAKVLAKNPQQTTPEIAILHPGNLTTAFENPANEFRQGLAPR